MGMIRKRSFRDGEAAKQANCSNWNDTAHAPHLRNAPGCVQFIWTSDLHRVDTLKPGDRESPYEASSCNVS